MSDVYVYQADIYCADCAKFHLAYCKNAGVADNGDSDTFPQGPFSNGGGESDRPQHCADCSEFLENPLTHDGYEYVHAELVKNRWHYYDENNKKITYVKGILKDWQEFYGYMFENGHWITPECEGL